MEHQLSLPTPATQPRPLGPVFIVAGAVAVLVVGVVTGLPMQKIAPALAVGAFVAINHARLLSFRNLLGLMVLVILFIPARRYVFPGATGIALDPFRVLTGVILLGWIASLLSDPRVVVRRSGLEQPIALLVLATLGSEVANISRVSALETKVFKELSFFLSFLIIFYLIVSVVRPGDVDTLVKLLVGGGAVVAAFAVIEARTNFNPFDHLTKVIPLLREEGGPRQVFAGRGLRAYGSAQHPIALGAALVMLIPLAVYLVRRTNQRRWWTAAALFLLGTLSTMSRTSVVMLIVVAAVFFWLRPREMRRLWPAVLPALILVHFALPGTLGTLKNSFFPRGGIVAEQTGCIGCSGQGRLADVGPGIQQWKEKPFLGHGYGTRSIEPTQFTIADGQILDNQWLGTLIDVGLVGGVAVLWLYVAAIRRFAREARRDLSTRGWLLAALSASITSLAVGQFFFDAFAFIQVTLLLFIFLALGCVLLRDEGPRPTPRL